MYEITVKVLVKGPKDLQYMRTAEKLVHGLAQDLLVGNSVQVPDGEVTIIGASADWAREVKDDEDGE
jgi:hypothetical protein